MTQRDDLVRWALAQVGKPYSTYRDCSGFAAAAYRQVGITIPEGSVTQYWAGKPTRGPVPEPGDLLFFDTYGAAPGHVAMWVGDGHKIVHALNEEQGIVVSDEFDHMGGNNIYMGARLFLPADSTIEDDPAPVEEKPRPKAPAYDDVFPKHQRRHTRRRRTNL